MTQEDKELLLKDLCGRLPYGVKVLNTAENVNEISLIDSIYFGRDTLVGLTSENDSKLTGIEMIKPYLFPLSSMTPTQVKEFYRIKGLNLSNEELIRFKSNYLSVVSNISSYSWSIDWLNKHHFDYRGLIEKGLAIDATNLNIY